MITPIIGFGMCASSFDLTSPIFLDEYEWPYLTPDYSEIWCSGLPDRCNVVYMTKYPQYEKVFDHSEDLLKRLYVTDFHYYDKEQNQYMFFIRHPAYQKRIQTEEEKAIGYCIISTGVNVSLENKEKLYFVEYPNTTYRNSSRDMAIDQGSSRAYLIDGYSIFDKGFINESINGCHIKDPDEIHSDQHGKLYYATITNQIIADLYDPKDMDFMQSVSLF